MYRESRFDWKKKLDLTWRKFWKFNHDIENFDLIQQKLFWSNPDSDII